MCKKFLIFGALALALSGCDTGVAPVDTHTVDTLFIQPAVLTHTSYHTMGSQSGPYKFQGFGVGLDGTEKQLYMAELSFSTPFPYSIDSVSHEVWFKKSPDPAWTSFETVRLAASRDGEEAPAGPFWFQGKVAFTDNDMYMMGLQVKVIITKAAAR